MVESSPDTPISVTIHFVSSSDAGDLRGFYFTEQIPKGLIVEPIDIRISGIGSLSDYLIESGTEEDIYTDYIPFRWIFELPPFFKENNPIAPSTVIEIEYSISPENKERGSFFFSEFNWVGYYKESLGEKAAFGHSEQSDQLTILFTYSIPASGDEIIIEDNAQEPVVKIIDAPTGITNAIDYTVTIERTGIVSYRWKLDTGTWSAETNADDELTFSVSSEGDHTLSIIGQDTYGKWQQETNTTIARWTIDRTAPVAELSNYPRGTVGITSTNIIVHGVDVAYYRYRMNGIDGKWSAICPHKLPIQVTNLPEGEQRLEVIGMDPFGNWQSQEDATIAIWEIDPQVPTALLSNLNPQRTNITSTHIIVSADTQSAPIDGFNYSIDEGLSWSYKTITETIDLMGLTEGPHTLYVNAYSTHNDTWQDNLNGETIDNATTYNWIVDVTSPAEITALYAEVGTPPSSVIELSWKAMESGLRKYYIRYSQSYISEANWEEALSLFCDILPGPSGYIERFRIQGLTAGTTYYFAVKSEDRATNISQISNVATCTTDNTLPLITDYELTEGGLATDNSTERELTITGINFTGDDIVRFINSSIVFDITSKAGTAHRMYTDLFSGIPIGVYTIQVINVNGTSPVSDKILTIAQAPQPLPEVTGVTPQIAANTAKTILTIFGDNFIAPLSASLVLTDNGSPIYTSEIPLTDVTRISSHHVKALKPADLAKGLYTIRITTPNGSNTDSAVKFEVYTPLALSTCAGTKATTDGVKVSDDGVVPIKLTLSTKDENAQVADTRMVEIKVSIDPGTEIYLTDTTPYTGTIDPPRQISIIPELADTLPAHASIFTMGKPVQGLLLGNNQTMIAIMDITMPAHLLAPLIYYLETDGSLSLAGIDGEKDDQTYTRGGTVLATQINVPKDGSTRYTLGVLLNHMSTFIIGTESDEIEPADTYPEDTHIKEGNERENYCFITTVANQQF